MLPRSEKEDYFHKLMVELNCDDNGEPKKENVKMIVFTATKRFCDQLGQQLRGEKFSARAIHGDMEQVCCRHYLSVGCSAWV